MIANKALRVKNAAYTGAARKRLLQLPLLIQLSLDTSSRYPIGPCNVRARSVPILVN